MTVDRILPTDEAHDLLDLATELADRELAPRAADFEARGEFPREVLRTLGRAGLLGLPYPEEYGGAGQPYEVYLQVLEILAGRWLAVAEAVSVHTLPATRWPRSAPTRSASGLPDMLGGELLGAYCLSEPQGGSDAASLTTRAVRDGDDYLVTGTKAWITHAGVADFYNVFCRTGGPGPEGISCLLADAGTPGIAAAGRRADHGPALLAGGAGRLRRRPGAGRPAASASEGAGFRIAMSALDSRPARHRRLRGRPGPGGAGLRGRLRPGAAAVRPADHRLPGRSASCSPTWPPRSPPPAR